MQVKTVVVSLYLQYIVIRWLKSASESYIDGLKKDAKAYRKYMKKLSLLELGEKSDPFVNDNNVRFSDDLSKWPPVEYGHIYGYFIKRPGSYTEEELLAWKSLNAYNLFTSGQVHLVYVMDTPNNC